MCLARVYTVDEGGNEELVANSVTEMLPGNGYVDIIDLFGQKMVISGVLESMDFESSTVKIRVTEKS